MTRRRRRGYHLSKAARAHMSAARRGKHHRHRGHKMSAATRKKIADALRGRHHTRRKSATSARKAKQVRRTKRLGATKPAGHKKAPTGRRVKASTARQEYRVKVRKIRAGTGRGPLTRYRDARRFL